MKIGILSDIHSNLDALEIVLKRLEHEQVEAVYCLGDIVGYGANPNECVALIRETCKVCIVGNHDDALVGRTATHYFNSYAQAALDWTKRVISDDNLEFLRSLPLTHVEDALLLVHATPADPSAWNYILRSDDAEQHFRVMAEKTTAFIGHSHIPVQFNDSAGKAIINTGSVGQPRDRDPRACCALFDSQTKKMEWLREVYPVQEAARKIRGANLPEFLAARLFIGM